MSFTRSLSAKISMQLWRNYRKIWTTGWSTKTMNELINARCAAAGRQWKLNLMVNLSGKKRV